ncbi:MAG: FAD-binding oxidoreductase [Xanthomonadaceae bacterium]|nr:FAD-binding oxidoreductase [Xanthomonadaceae bacterium]
MTSRADTPSAADLRSFASALRDSGFAGDILTDEASRLALATDNSVYQVVPAMVLAPRDGEDLTRLVTVAAREEFAAIRLAARGGGTGTNGQSLTDGVVVDTSRYMNHILEIDPEARTVRVEPGVVLGQLNAALAAHDLFFPPLISTATRATLGGMVSTDACGKGSRVYGRTGDYVESMRLLLVDGRHIESRRITAEELTGKSDDPAVLLARELKALVAPVRQEIEAVFPKISRSLTGYNLRDAFPADGSVDLNRLVAGAEGTLAFIQDITLRVTERPTHKRLVVIRYANFDAALADARNLLGFDPTAIETLDQRVYELARQDPSWVHTRHAMESPQSPGRALVVNFVEFAGRDEAEVEAKTMRLVEALARRDDHLGYHVSLQEHEQAALWAVRTRSVGLLGRVAGRRKPVPFVEDTVVPPEHLADYIREFRAVLDRHGVSYGMFGHVDVGCLHVRPALDMKDPADREKLRAITEEVVALVKRYGGLLWGEHGKGYRGEFARDFFGDRLYPVLAGIKRVFDPRNRLNPGKIVTPDPEGRGVIPIDGVPFRGELDSRIPAADQERWAKALECNGNGVCFDWSAATPICPSYKVTRDRVHSPKGRADLLRAWLRLSGEPAEGDAAVHEAFTQQVYDALHGCLGCKACASQCPVHVDIPTLRARFLERYHESRPRPLRDRLIGRLETLLPLMARQPRLINRLMRMAPVRALVRRSAGLVDFPALDERPFGRRLRPSSPAEIVAASRRSGGRTVALLPDAFTGHFEADVLIAGYELLRALGYDVHVLPYLPSGKAEHVRGYLARFRRTGERLLTEFGAVFEAGVPVVGVEPSVVLCLRQEYQQEIGRAAPVQLIQEWLAEQALDRIAVRATSIDAAAPASYRLIPHCTEKTALPAAGKLWQQIFAAAGLKLGEVAAGCCGMSGTYGHEVEHQKESRRLYEMSWQQPVREHGEQLLATGFSCRCQVARMEGVQLLHPLEVLSAVLPKQGMDGQENPQSVQ